MCGKRGYCENHIARSALLEKKILVCVNKSMRTLFPLFNLEKCAPGSESPSLRAPIACKPIVPSPSLVVDVSFRADVGPRVQRGCSAASPGRLALNPCASTNGPGSHPMLPAGPQPCSAAFQLLKHLPALF